MNAVDIATNWSNAQVGGEWDTFDNLTADEFQLIGPAPAPLGKEQFAQWWKSLLAGNSDVSNNFEITESTDDTVKGWLQVQGTHTSDWDLSFMGLGVIPATGKGFKNPREAFTVTVENGKVTKCEVDVPENSGIAGIFAQLGIS